MRSFYLAARLHPNFPHAALLIADEDSALQCKCHRFPVVYSWEQTSPLTPFKGELLDHLCCALVRCLNSDTPESSFSALCSCSFHLPPFWARNTDLHSVPHEPTLPSHHCKSIPVRVLGLKRRIWALQTNSALGRTDGEWQRFKNKENKQLKKETL